MAEYPLTRSREFAARTPDFNESLLRARDEGHTLADESVEHLKKTDQLKVGYYLSRPEQRDLRDKVENLGDRPAEQIAELDRIAAQLDRQGYGVKYDPRLREEDVYVTQRRMDIHSRKRRR